MSVKHCDNDDGIKCFHIACVACEGGHKNEGAYCLICLACQANELFLWSPSPSTQPLLTMSYFRVIACYM